MVEVRVVMFILPEGENQFKNHSNSHHNDSSDFGHLKSFPRDLELRNRKSVVLGSRTRWRF